jgi:hypothetical protein
MTTLDELEKLEKAATPGPWKWSLRHESHDREAFAKGPSHLGDHNYQKARADAELVAAARNALPDLLKIARAAANYARMAPPRGHVDEPARLAEMREALRAVGGWR